MGLGSRPCSVLTGPKESPVLPEGRRVSGASKVLEDPSEWTWGPESLPSGRPVDQTNRKTTTVHTPPRRQDRGDCVGD